MQAEDQTSVMFCVGDVVFSVLYNHEEFQTSRLLEFSAWCHGRGDVSQVQNRRQSEWKAHPHML